ncbi:MAG: hypothetical protein LBC09_00675, partial [Helicobacteraceae bacterium]|nr:hypothetical protein [Helicobacteraceae bacterium]
MILAFEFEYAARNAVLENFLRAIASEAKREFYIKKQNETITLFARGDADELKAFSDLLAAELPLSIFLRAASAKAVLEWKPDEASEIEPCEAVIGFTPKSLALAAQSGDFTIAPEIGRGANLTGMPPIDDLITALREQGRVEIAGKYALSLPDERFCDQNAVIMPTDIGFVANIAIAKEEDIAALGALERPIVRLPINMIFAAAYPDAPRITSVALAGDLYLCLLSRKLAE